MSQRSKRQQDNHVFLWIIWVALGLSSVAEVGLTMVASPPSSISLAEAFSVLESTPPTLIFLGALGSAFAVAIGVVFQSRLGGGGIATALVCWFLGKGIAVAGVSVYLIYGQPLLSAPFTVIFIVMIAVLNPRQFEH